KHHALVPALSLLAATLTPAGPAILATPLTVSGYTMYVTEWAPPSIFAPATACALLLLAVPVLRWTGAATRAVPVEVALVIVAVGVTLAYERTVAVGAAMAVPLAARAIGNYPF